MVEWKTIGDVTEILDSRRKPVSKDKRCGGIYPYYGANGIQDYVDDYLFDGEYILLGEDGSVINDDKSPILHWATGKIWVNNHAHVLQEKDGYILRYIYYALQCVDVSGIVRGTPPKINQANLRNILIPVPLLTEQNRIVGILDTFTASIENLKQQIEQRKKQYEHYRDQLLDLEGKLGIEMIPIQNLGSFYGGLTGKSKKDFENGNAKFITYMNVFSNPSLDISTVGNVFINDGEKQNKVQKGDILFSGSSETADEAGMSCVVTDDLYEDYYLNSFCFGLRLNNPMNYNLHFLKHLLRSRRIRNAISRTANGVTRYNISKARFGKVVIPIPSLEKQNYIVEKLDIFIILIDSLQQQLEQRQKQFEYYRNKLLTFE